MATIRDLPQELVDMVVARVPATLYVLLLKWEPIERARTHTAFHATTLGVYGTAQQAIEIGREIMKQKVKEVDCTERVIAEENGQKMDDGDYYYEPGETTGPNGSTRWGVWGTSGEQEFHLYVQKRTFLNASSRQVEVPMPSNGVLHHATRCRCFDESDDESSTGMSDEEGVEDDEETDTEEEGEGTIEDQEDMENGGSDNEGAEVSDMEE